MPVVERFSLRLLPEQRYLLTAWAHPPGFNQFDRNGGRLQHLQLHRRAQNFKGTPQALPGAQRMGHSAPKYSECCQHKFHTARVACSIHSARCAAAETRARRERGGAADRHSLLQAPAKCVGPSPKSACWPGAVRRNCLPNQCTTPPLPNRVPASSHALGSSALMPRAIHVPEASAGADGTRSNPSVTAPSRPAVQPDAAILIAQNQSQHRLATGAAHQRRIRRIPWQRQPGPSGGCTAYLNPHKNRLQSICLLARSDRKRYILILF